MGIGNIAIMYSQQVPGFLWQASNCALRHGTIPPKNSMNFIALRIKQLSEKISILSRYTRNYGFHGAKYNLSIKGLESYFNVLSKETLIFIEMNL